MSSRGSLPNNHTSMKLIGTALLTIGLSIFFVTKEDTVATLKELNDDFDGLNFKSYDHDRNKAYLFEGEISRESEVVGEFFTSQSGPTQTFLYKFKHAPDIEVLSENDIGDKGEIVKFWGRPLEGMVGVINLYRTPKSLYLAGIGASLLILGIIKSRIIRNRSIKEAQPEKQEDSKANHTPHPES